MKLLASLDSRIDNKAGFILFDFPKGTYLFQEIAVHENVKRRGFRGFCRKGDTICVVNSVALYFFRLLSTDRYPFLQYEKTVRRPEWELGERAAADLHHVIWSTERNCYLIANSFMDAVDKVSDDGTWLGRDYLWDIFPEIHRLAAERVPGATDLVHINHLLEFDGRLYATFGNINNSRKGAIGCLDTGELILRNLDFPHDGLCVDGDLYVTNTGTSTFEIYPFHPEIGETAKSVNIPVRQPGYQPEKQWLRGVAVTSELIMLGATQLRADVEGENANLVPPRIVFLERSSLEFLGEVFLPKLSGFRNPCLYSLLPLEEQPGSINFAYWPPPEEDDDSKQVTIEFPDSGLASLIPESNCFAVWEWCDDKNRVSVSRIENETHFNFDLRQDHSYLISDRPGRVSLPPENGDSYPLRSDTVSQLTVDLSAVSDSALVSAFLLQYCGAKKLSSNSLKLRAGKNRLVLKTEPDATNFRIAFRFSGRGSCSISGMSLTQADEKS